MNKYVITIEETLCRTIVVNADSDENAYRKVEELYHSGDIVLSADDFVGVEFYENDEEDSKEMIKYYNENDIKYEEV